MLSFVCFAPVERLAGKIVYETTHNVLSGALNARQLNVNCLKINILVLYMVV